jgi:hypothetical protein
MRWIESDTLLRTEDGLVDEAARLLGFRRKGVNIEAAVARAPRSSVAGARHGSPRSLATVS